MAYLDRQTFAQRLANLGTAGIIELALGAALIAGLSINFVPEDEAPQLAARNIPDPAPPPPDAPQPRVQQDIVIDTPQPRIEIDTPVRPEIPTVDNPPSSFDGTIEFPPRDPPRVTPSFSPVAPKAANDPSRWVTTDDYPARDLSEGNQGVTRFRAIVGSNGRVQNCEVTRSSGFPSLDKAACANVIRRARFEPATDESGARVVGSYSGSVRWQIPG